MIRFKDLLLSKLDYGDNLDVMNPHVKLEPLLSMHRKTNQQKQNNNNKNNNRKQTQQPITTTNNQASKQTKSYTVEYNDIELDLDIELV